MFQARLLRALTGNIRPMELASSVGDGMTIVFTADGDGQQQGFRCSYVCAIPQYSAQESSKSSPVVPALNTHHPAAPRPNHNSAIRTYTPMLRPVRAIGALLGDADPTMPSSEPSSPDPTAASHSQRPLRLAYPPTRPPEPSPTASPTETSAPIDCSGTVATNDVTGYLGTTPLVPISAASTYRVGTICGWRIHTGRTIDLRFDAMMLLSVFDRVTVYDGPDANSIVLGVFSGTVLPPLITARTGVLYVEFRSDCPVGEFNPSESIFSF